MNFRGIELPPAYYQDEWVYIIHGDCREILPSIPDKSIDLVLTDPPYGIKRDKGFEGFGGFGGFGTPIARRRYEQDNWDAERINATTIKDVLRVSKQAIISDMFVLTKLK